MPDANDLKPKSSLDGDLNPHIQAVTKKYSHSNGITTRVTRPVVTGKTTVRKKNVIDRLDIPGIVTDAVVDKIVPDLRDIAFNSITSVLSTIFYGDDRAARRSGYSHPSTIRTSTIRNLPYNSIYQNERNYADDHYAHPTGVYDPDDIIFANRNDAENVYRAIGNIIDNYGQASVADLYDAANLSNMNVSNSYGWRDISDARIRMVREGYILILPKPIRLD